jgi:two-component sensor histidine kinase
MAARLQALSAAHDMMQISNEGAEAAGTNLTDLLRTILRSYAGHILRLDGPAVHLDREATTVLALVFHELATNAAKYGALASPLGKIEVVWHGAGNAQ